MTRRFRFWYGFLSSFAVVILLNGLSIFEVWGHDCSDCYGWGGVPYQFLLLGGSERWAIDGRSLMHDLAVAAALSSACGLASVLLLRRAN